MSVSEHANYLLNEYGRLQFDYAAYYKPYGESLRNEARNNLETYIAELEAENRNLMRNLFLIDDTEKIATLNTRIAELEELVDKLIEVGGEMSDQSYWHEIKWQALVKDWKEREE